MDKICEDCGKKITGWYSKLCRSCAKKGLRNPMSGKRGDKHHNYKGGYIHPSLGYKLIQHNAKKAYEHRVIAEKILGRKLRKGELVHHLNHIKSDNRPENLVVLGSQQEHIIRHAEERRYCRKGHLYSKVGFYKTEGHRRCRKCTLDRMKARGWK